MTYRNACVDGDVLSVWRCSSSKESSRFIGLPSANLRPNSAAGVDSVSSQQFITRLGVSLTAFFVEVERTMKTADEIFFTRSIDPCGCVWVAFDERFCRKCDA